MLLEIPVLAFLAKQGGEKKKEKTLKEEREWRKETRWRPALAPLGKESREPLAEALGASLPLPGQVRQTCES